MRQINPLAIFLVATCIVLFSPERAFSQSCSGCSINFSSDQYDDIIVVDGETTCIADGVHCYGNVILQGGTLCNRGIVSQLVVTNQGGVIDNFGTIESSQTDINLTADLMLNNYPLASFKFMNSLTVEMSPTAHMYLHFYNSSSFECLSDFTTNSGEIDIDNGIVWAGYPDDLSNVNFRNVVFGGSNVTIENSVRGNILVAGYLTLNGTSPQTINNSGTVTVSGTLNNGKANFTNDGHLMVETELDIVGGSFVNNNQAYTGKLDNQSEGSITNAGNIGVATILTNEGEIDLGISSMLSTSDYYNTGSISGPMLTPPANAHYDNWAKIFIYGFSRNSSSLSGNTLIFETTLNSTADNIGFGFDEVSNTRSIKSPVKYVVTSVGPGATPTTTMDCAASTSEYWLRLNTWAAKASLCPGENVQLTGMLAYQLQLPPNLVQPPSSPIPNPTYVWAPGSLTGQTVVVTPSVTTVYTMTATYKNCTYTTTIAVEVKTICPEEIIGCCFANYGADVWINSSNTYLNVYCNVINELGLSTDGIQHGDFQSKSGYLRVYLNWYHNAKNLLYIPANNNTVTPTWGPNIGVTSFFGAAQKIKGNSNTSFNNLWLEGTGPKSIWIDEFGHNDLVLNDKIFLLQNYVFAMKNENAAVNRTLGYATTDLNGYFSRVLANATSVTNQKYLFPLGASATSSTLFRYRPLVMANNSTSQADEISANFMNAHPALTDPEFVNPTLTNNVTLQAPSVLQINNSYYHKIKNTTPPPAISNVSLKSYYYLPSDGLYQSLAEWEKGPLLTYDWWGMTPGASSSTIASIDPGTSGLAYAQANGTLTFVHPPFTLARGGFYINTNSFGNQGNSAGTTFSVSGSSYGGGGTPTGGGLGTSFGTGSSSGNGGNGGVTTFTPNPVSGEYVITVTPPDNCQVPGKIRFIVDQNGNIQNSDVLYGIAGVNGYLGQLSDDVYSIDYINSGLNLLSSPRALLKSCINTITVCTSGASANHIVDVTTNGENLVVKLPSTAANNVVTYGSLNIYNSSSALVPISPLTLTGGTTNNVTPTTAFTPGVYRFEFLIIASVSPPISETIKGQFIVK